MIEDQRIAIPFQSLDFTMIMMSSVETVVLDGYNNKTNTTAGGGTGGIDFGQGASVVVVPPNRPKRQVSSNAKLCLLMFAAYS
jgi:hypothetical protein